MPVSVEGIVQTVIMSAISAVVSYGVGTIATTIGQGICASTTTMTQLQVNIITAVIQAGMHGIVQGAISGITGGNFLSGFLSGFFSSAASSWAGGGKPGSFRASTGGTLFIGALTGGVGSVLGGGNFWMGAATGLIVTGFNHLMHKLSPPPPANKLKDWLEKAGVKFDDVPNMSAEQVLELINKVPELKNKYEESGSFDIGIDESLTQDGYTHDGRLGVKGFMDFGPSAFKDMLTLGTTIIHESYHAWSVYYGRAYNYLKWANYDPDAAEVLTEFEAYDYELKYAHNEFALQQRNELYKILLLDYGINPYDLK